MSLHKDTRHPKGGESPNNSFLVDLFSYFSFHIERFWYVLSCLWDDAYTRSLGANLNKICYEVAAADFFSYPVSDPCHTSVTV